MGSSHQLAGLAWVHELDLKETKEHAPLKLVTKGSEGRWTMKIYRYLWLLWLESGKSYKYV